MTEAPATQLHATCVDVDGIGVLILGAAGAGKSNLALQVIDGGAKLVADDRTDVRLVGADLRAAAPKALQGRIEVRGIGIVPLDQARVLAETHVQIVVRPTPAADIVRLPEPAAEDILGKSLPLFRIDPAQAGAGARIRLLADACKRGILRFDDDLRS